jgi:hypothetical protein
MTGAMFVAGRYVIALHLTYGACVNLWRRRLAGAAAPVGVPLVAGPVFGAALTKAGTLESGKAVVPRAMAVRIKEEIID